MRCWRLRGKLLRSRNDVKLLSARQTEHTEVAPVQREHRFNALPICQMHQACVGDLYPQPPILCEDGCDSGEVGLIQRKKLKGLAVERGQQHPEGRWVCPQKPGRFGDHRPTCEQRPLDTPKLFYARSMVFVRRGKDRYNRAGVD